MSRFKHAVAVQLLPAVRCLAQNSGALRPFLWRRIVVPYFTWRRKAFVVKTQRGFRMAGETDEVIQNYIYFLGQWEPHVAACISRRLKPGDLFVDVGANIGYFTLYAVNLGAEAVCIEASSRIYERLDRNLKLNGFEQKVRAIRGAVADETKSMRFYCAPSENCGLGSLVRETEQFETVDAAPLGSWLTAGEIRRARLIKIDVEGAEVEVMRGIREILGQLPENVELLVEVLPATYDAVVAMLPGFHAYALPADVIGHYFAKQEIRALRVTGPPSVRVDVLFSRTDAEWL